MIQVIDSIPWVRCASGNVSFSIFISSNFGHQIALHALVVDLANIRYKFGHQVLPLALVSILATRWRHLHCHIVWDFPLASSVGIELLSSTARVTSVKSAKGVVT